MSDGSMSGEEFLKELAENESLALNEAISAKDLQGCLEVLRKAAVDRKLDSSLADDGLDTRLRDLAMAREPTNATPIAEQLKILRESSLGQSHRSTLRAMTTLAALDEQGTKGHATSAVHIAAEALGADDPDTILARLFALRETEVGQRVSAAKSLLADCERLFPEDHPLRLRATRACAVICEATEPEFALGLARKAAEGSLRALGEDDLQTSLTALALVGVERAHGSRDEASVLARGLVERLVKSLGHDSPMACYARAELVTTLWQSRSVSSSSADQLWLAEATSVAVENAAALERRFGASDLRTFAAREDLGGLHLVAHRWSEGEATFRALHGDFARHFGKENRGTLIIQASLASAIDNQNTPKKESEARELRAQTLEAMRRTLGEEHPDTQLELRNKAASEKAIAARHARSRKRWVVISLLLLLLTIPLAWFVFPTAGVMYESMWLGALHGLLAPANWMIGYFVPNHHAHADTCNWVYTTFWWIGVLGNWGNAGVKILTAGEV